MSVLSHLRRVLELQRQWEEDIKNIERAKSEPRFAAPYVPTPMNVVMEMLSLAEVQKGDVLYDLGCGDGRILLAAALEYGARCIGIEIREDLVKVAITALNNAGMGTRTKVIHGDMFEQDLSEATVVMLYLLSTVNIHLKPKLEAELKKGTRVVCHDYGIECLRPSATKAVREHVIKHTLYLYRI